MTNLGEGVRRIGVTDAINFANKQREDGRLGVAELPRPDEKSQRAIALIWPEDLHIWTEHFHNMDRIGAQWRNLQMVFENSVLFAMPSNEMWRVHHDLMFSGMSAHHLGELPEVTAHFTDQCISKWPKDIAFEQAGYDLTKVFKEINMKAGSEILLGYPLEHKEMLELNDAMVNLHSGASVEVNAIWAKQKDEEVFNDTTNAGLERLRAYARAVRKRVQQLPEASPVVAELIAREGQEHFGEDKTLHEILAILFGSLSTLSSSQMSLLYLLSQPENYHWQQTVRTIQGQERNKLVKAMFKEALRLYPSIYVHSRDVTQEFEFTDSVGNNIRLQTGDKIVIFPSVTHRLTWDDPEVFDPTRHLNENLHKSRPQHSFIAFGFGPHVCVGAPTAMIGGPVPVVQILDKFEISLKEAYDPEPEYGFTMVPNRQNAYSFKRLT